MTTPTDRAVPTYNSLAQASRITERSVHTIRRRVSDGSPPAYTFGPRHIRIRLEGLEALGRPIPNSRS